MSWLAKKLSLLFFLIAIILLLLVTIINNFTLLTIVWRTIIGGLVFGLVGGGIGEILASYIETPTTNKSSSSSTEVEKKEAQNKTKEDSDIEPLDFDTVDKTEENIINKAQEAPEEVADMIKNMSQE